MKTKSVNQIILSAFTIGLVHYVIGLVVQKGGYNYAPSVTKSLIVVAALIAMDAIMGKFKTSDKDNHKE